MPEVPDHLGHGGYSGSPFWLAIGPTAAEALRAHGASFFETDAPAIEEVDDVIGALVLLSHRRALLSAWQVERPLSQPAAASAHDCTVLMQTLIGLPSVNPDQVRRPSPPPRTQK